MTPAQRLRHWRQDPIQFVKDNFQTVPDKWQEKFLLAFVSNDPKTMRIALLACAGPGKTACLSWAGWLFLSCFAMKGLHPKGACISISKDNLQDNLWAEFSKWQQRSPYLMREFVWKQKKIFQKDNPGTWFLSARSWPRSASAEEQGNTLSGFHEEFMLFLVDESGDIPLPVLKKGNQALTGGRFQKIVQAGNPTSHDGMLYYASTSDRWHVINITADPDDPDRTPRVPKEEARLAIEEWGRDDPWVMSYILGQFPRTALKSLLYIDEVEAAMNRFHEPSIYEFSQRRLGVDVALYGDDSTVIFPRQGLQAFKPVEMRGATPSEIAARVMVAKQKWGSEYEFIDDTGGFGSGVIDSLRNAGQIPLGVHFAGKASDPKYKNVRAEMWLKLADWVRAGGALPKNNRLKKELCAPTYALVNGKLALERKDQIKSRLGLSPDFADALALTFYHPEANKLSDIEKLQRSYVQNNQEDYDPFKDL